MSMIAYLIRVPAPQLENYKADSAQLEKDLEQFFEQAAQEFEQELQESEQDGREEGTTPRLLDLDKAWDGIIFLLCGKPLFDIDLADRQSLSRVILSSELIDEEQDLGYGPAHYLTADEVAAFAPRLNAITPEDLRRNFLPEKMEDVYPDIWQDESETALEYLQYHFKQLQKFYTCAAEEKQAVIGFIS
ncbi:MAG: YfbM family protein [Neisseria sp.]|nr:YfbM family protein [Neisseria sp.]